jgi:hypothetical protein
MIAMTSCVKWLAVPGPPPGPWEAIAKLAESKAAADVNATAVNATAKGECHFRGKAMMISRDEKLQKIRVGAYAGFERCRILACDAEADRVMRNPLRGKCPRQIPLPITRRRIAPDNDHRRRGWSS